MHVHNLDNREYLFITFPAHKSMVEPWFAIVRIRVCMVELAFTFGKILRVTVQHLQIDTWKTMRSKCLKSISIEGKGFTDTIFRFFTGAPMMTKRLTLSRILVHDKLFPTELGGFRASRCRISDSCAIYACGGSTMNSKILHIPKGSLHSECL